MSKTHLFFVYSLLVLSLFLSALSFWKNNNGQIEEDEMEAESEPYFSDYSLSRDSIRIFELPKELDFAGEKVPLEQADILERLEREIYINAYWESNMILLLKRSEKYLPEMEKMLKEQGIPDDFKYLAIAESGLMNVGSPAGARGYWQILEATGKEYGLEISKFVDERYHFEKATIAAAKYFKKAHEKFGDWTAVAASYNMGQSGFSKRQEEQFHKNYFDLYLNEETSRYLFRILAFKLIFENPGSFGYHLKEKEYYRNPEFNFYKVSEDIRDLAQWAKSKGSSFKYLKLYNPWLRDRALNTKRGKVYEIRLPKGEIRD